MTHTTRLLSFSKPALLLSVLLVATVAGCIDQPDQECEGGVCTQTAKPGDAFLTNATRPILEFAGCHGTIIGLDVPPEVLEGHLPDAFVPRSQVPGLGNVRISAWECPKAMVGNVAVEPYRIAVASILALPVDRAWQGEGTAGEFVLELFVNNETAAEQLSGWGLSPRVAEFEIGRISLAVGEQETWSVTAEDRGYTFTSTFVSGNRGGGGAGSLALWAGDSTFWRVDANYTWLAHLNTQGVDRVTAEGDAVLADLIGSSAFPVRAQAYRVYDDAWVPYPIPFHAS